MDATFWYLLYIGGLLYVPFVLWRPLMRAKPSPRVVRHFFLFWATCIPSARLPALNRSCPSNVCTHTRVRPLHNPVFLFTSPRNRGSSGSIVGDELCMLCVDTCAYLANEPERFFSLPFRPPPDAHAGIGVAAAAAIFYPRHRSAVPKR